jgi:hypothetical protein
MQSAYAIFIIICGLSGSSIFFTLSHKLSDFQKKVNDHKMFVLSLHLVSETFSILRMSGDIINVCRSSS